MKKTLFSLLILLLSLPGLSGAAGGVQDEGELLDPAVAFKFEARAVDANMLVAEWTVAEGYYLYRDKIRFAITEGDAILGEPSIPPGKIKNDEFFGEVAIFRDTVRVKLPITAQSDTVTLEAISQGCADIGVCYPPQTQSVTLTLPEASAADPVAELTGLAQDLGGQSEGELLDPDVAFFHSVEVEAGERALVARWRIADGYYMYRDKFQFELKGSDAVSLGEPEYPAGEMKDDEFFGRIEVYKHDVAIRLPMERPDEAVSGLTLVTTSQGCAEIGVCYPPVIKETAFDLEAAGEAPPPAQAVSTAATTAAGSSLSDLDFGNVDSLIEVLTGGSLGLMLGISLIAGVIIAFTACMYPMIPILSSLIVGQGEKMTAGRGFLFSLVYVEAMAVTFGIMGGIMAVIGAGVGIQAYFQSPWLLIPFALLFILLALGMFGFYNIQVPSFIQSRLNALSNQQKGGSFLGVAVMGALSALIIGPCGGPVLVAELAYAGASESVVKGFLALFVFGNGMGLPLLLVGLTGGKLLPKAGTWMNAVKAVAGAILLAVGIVMLERMPGIFPIGLTMTLWALLFIIGGVYMGALEPIKEGVSGWMRFWKGLGITFVFYGFVVLLGGMTGGSSVTDPLHGSRLIGGDTTMVAASGTASGTTSQAKLEFKTIKTLADFRSEVASASAEGKSVMLDFYADWCTYCKQFEKYVFSDPGVQQALANTVLLKADVTATDAQDRELMEALGVFLPPAILFVGEDGEERRAQRVVGYMEADAFRARIEQAFGN